METITSCGSIVVKDDKFLIAKPYQNKKWNLPKGKMDANESYMTTARRETLEECNINIAKSLMIKDLGKFPYLKGKDLYLFLVVIDYEPELKCNSTFLDTYTNKKVPEMVAFKWIGFDEYQTYMSNSMNLVLDSAISKIKVILQQQ